MPAARYVQARQYACVFRSSSLESRSAVFLASVPVGRTSVISCVMSSPPLCEPRSPCSRSPCDHAFPVHYRKPRDQAVGVVVTADPEEVVQTAVPRVSADERLEPHLARDRPDEVPIEMNPARLSAPALLLAESEMDIRRDADETEHARVEAELLLEHARAVREQRLLDRLAREPATAGKLERREQWRGRRLFPFRGIGEVLDEHVLGDERRQVRSEERRVGKECGSRWSP